MPWAPPIRSKMGPIRSKIGEKRNKIGEKGTKIGLFGLLSFMKIPLVCPSLDQNFDYLELFS